MRPLLVPWTAGAINLLTSAATLLGSLGMSRLLEGRLCRDYDLAHEPARPGPDVVVHKERCTLADVNADYSYWLWVIQLVPLACELVGAIHMGYVSDRAGRKPVMFISITATMLCYAWYIVVCSFYNVFPLWTLALGPLVFLASGSVMVTRAQVNAVVADVAKETSMRTSIFSWIAAASYLLTFSVPLIPKLYRAGPGVLFALGALCFILVLVLAAFLPDTRPPQAAARAETPAGSGRPGGAREHARPTAGRDEEAIGGEYEPLLGRDRDRGDAPEASGEHADHITVAEGGSRLLRNVRELLGILRNNPSYLYCLAVLLVLALATPAESYWFFKYPFSRYQIGYEVIIALIFVNAGTRAALLAIAIPGGLWYLRGRTSLSPTSVNLWGLRASLGALAAGYLLMGLSPVLWAFLVGFAVHLLGSGLEVFALSAMADAAGALWGDDAHMGRTYSAVAFVEIAGALVGIPMLNALWALATRLGGFGLGIPWFLDVVLLVAAGYLAWRIKL